MDRKPKYPERHRPAHFPPVEHYNERVILFLTICVSPRVPVLASDEFHAVFRDAVADADR